MSLFHNHNMILQQVRADGVIVYQCECGAILTVTMMTGPSSVPIWSPYATTGQIPLKPRTPVPDAFYKAFEGDSEDGVLA